MATVPLQAHVNFHQTLTFFSFSLSVDRKLIPLIISDKLEASLEKLVIPFNSLYLGFAHES